MTKRNSSGLRNAGTIATVAALTLGSCLFLVLKVLFQ